MQVEMKHTEGDGNCHLRSLLISVLGSEESGWVALRLRCLLHFLVNSARYHQAESGPGVASTDYGASVFTPLTKPASSLSGLASAIAASVLQCPILLFNPGHKMIPHRELESGYIPPLFVREGGYASKLPIIQMWAYCGGGAPVETTPWRPNHFEAGFLPTAAHYSALLSVTEQHDLHLQGYYEQGAGRDPGWAWDTQTRYELHQLPNESPERHLIEEVLTSVQNILAPRPAMARRGRQGASGGPGPKPSPAPFPPPPGKAAQPIGTMGDGPPPRLAQRHQTRLSVAAAQAINIDRGTGSQQSPAPPTGKSLKRKCIDASEGRRKIAKKSTQQDTSRMRKKKGETPPSPSGSPGRRCTHTAMHQQSDRGTRQTSIQEAMGKAAQRAQAGLPLLAHHQRQARLSRASLPNRGKTRQAATTGDRETLMAELADPGVAAPLSASESATQAAPPGLDPEACAPAPGPVGEFKVATFNCMGGTTAEGAIEALVQRDPDALVLTELKINSRQQRKNVYRKLLHRGYKITMSVLPGGSLLSHAGQPGRGKAGVLVAMAKRHTTHNSLAPQTVPAQLQGYLSHVRLTPPAGRPLDIIGVYLPSDADEQHTRRAAGTYILEISRACAQQGRTLVLAGDWNATLRNADRSTGSQHHVDTAHRELAATCQLAPAGGIPTDPTEPREPTYCQHVVGGQAVRSTIDDVLICLPTLPDEVTKWAPAPWQIPAAGGNSDHEPYEVRLPCSALGYVRPPPQTHVPFRSRTVFQQPMSIAELTGYRDAFEAAAHRGISCFARSSVR